MCVCNALHVCMCIYIYTYIERDTYMCIYIYIYTNIYIYIHTYIQIYIYILCFVGMLVYVFRLLCSTSIRSHSAGVVLCIGLRYVMFVCYVLWIMFGIMLGVSIVMCWIMLCYVLYVQESSNRGRQ